MQEDPFPLSAVLIIFFVLVNGFFVAAEFAIVKVKSSRIDILVSTGNGRARFASRLIANPTDFLSACQLGITFSSLGLGWVGGPAAVQFLNPLLVRLELNEGLLKVLSIMLAFGCIAFLHLVFGELAPKTIAIRKSEQLALLAAGPLVFFYRIIFPFIRVLSGVSDLLLRWIGIDPASASSSAHTEKEIRILMKESHESGYIDHTELMLVDNIFKFAETQAREIMIPRTEMNCLSMHSPFEENRNIALELMHTRYPVCDGDKDNIIGFVHIKDLLKAGEEIRHLHQLIRPMATVPETMQISSLLKLMQRQRTHIAILIDEYGGTSGLVTLEDIMEEIVGEIQDEFDEERPDIEQVAETVYSLSGLLLLEEVNSRFGIDIHAEDYDTLGGWLYSRIDLPPQSGQAVCLSDTIELMIEETDHLRISRVLLKLTALS